jgi:hypothetical protein
LSIFGLWLCWFWSDLLLYIAHQKCPSFSIGCCKTHINRIKLTTILLSIYNFKLLLLILPMGPKSDPRAGIKLAPRFEDSFFRPYVLLKSRVCSSLAVSEGVNI